MLGELLGEEIGQMMGMRVMPLRDGMPAMEVSVQAQGTLLGEHVTDMHTYHSVQRPDGLFQGEGRGVVMTETGETLTWTAQGIGTPTGRGTGINWRGVLMYSTTSEKFARMTKQPAVFEYDVDDGGKAEGRIYEWK